MVQILSVSSCARGLPSEDQQREIDRYGMVWFAAEAGASNFSLRPEEISVV